MLWRSFFEFALLPTESLLSLCTLHYCTPVLSINFSNVLNSLVSEK